MKLHFEMEVPNSKVGVQITRQIHKLTGILPDNVTNYSEIAEMRPIAEVFNELHAENTRYSHLKIVQKAV